VVHLALKVPHHESGQVDGSGQAPEVSLHGHESSTCGQRNGASDGAEHFTGVLEKSNLKILVFPSLNDLFFKLNLKGY